MVFHQYINKKFANYLKACREIDYVGSESDKTKERKRLENASVEWQLLNTRQQSCENYLSQYLLRCPPYETNQWRI